MIGSSIETGTALFLGLERREVDIRESRSTSAQFIF